MGDAIDGGFGKFVPGFDFLQNLAKGASQSIPQIPNLANWVSPSLNVEDLQKRIEELRAVQFWLEQNSRALAATIQALEVQKMTLATLKGMNFNIGEMANVFKPKADDAAPAGVQMAAEPVSSTKTVPDAPPEVSVAASKSARKAKPSGAAPSVIDPLNLWSALTQQFQQIAASAMQGSTHPSAGNSAAGGGAAVAKQAVKKGKKAGAGGRQGAAKSASRGKAERRSTR
ncbi:MAG: PhaM family polyhydroxyalkanoate granule multifunctional regulatory protein [Burkholderiaceae bacterium]